MRCPRCKRKIKKSSNYCPICGKKIIIETNLENNYKKNNIYLIIIGILLLVVFLETYFLVMNYTDKKYKVIDDLDVTCECDNEDENDIKDDETIENQVYAFNETFSFDNYEISINDDYSFEVIDNEYSDYNGKTVVKLPITIKNNYIEARIFDIYSYDIYSFQDRIVDNASSYFEESIDHGSILEPNETYLRYFYFIYEGDGEYIVKFEKGNEHILVEIKIELSI